MQHYSAVDIAAIRVFVVLVVASTVWLTFDRRRTKRNKRRAPWQIGFTECKRQEKR